MMAAADCAMVGEMLHNEPLSSHTSWRVGGPARRFYKPADSADLISFLKQLPAAEPLLWLGLGSNILVRDGGFNGTVIATQGCLNGLELVGEAGLRAEAGVSSARVARFAAANDLCGVEFLAGIPGTMGGALALNAGAFGSETWDWVSAVETIDRSGKVRQRSPSDFSVGYRQVTMPEGEWFLSAQMELQSGDGAAALQNIQTLLTQRTATQPIGLPSCGSVFRNPEGDHAARLIDSAGLKGHSIGGATVSTKHANFIINSGGATAADIEALISFVQKRVEQESGIRLQPEVHIVGEEEAA
jgi:UDP-N-acetylmuramate dehydrogenase